MGQLHRLKFDGYYVGDRLLDQVYFAVEIEVDGNNAEIKDVTPWDEENAAYLAKFNINHFIPLIKERVQENIEYLQDYYERNGGSLEADMKQWEETEGEPGIQVLLEV